MSITDKYNRAFQRLELEKTADAYIERYGTSDGYLPEEYASAYIRLEKEASVQHVVDSFAPDTQYIPAGYVAALEKHGMLQQMGQAAVNTAKGMMGKIDPGKIKLTQKTMGDGSKKLIKTLNPDAKNVTLGDMGRFYGSKALGAMGRNPGTTAAVGAGTMGAGGLYAMSGD